MGEASDRVEVLRGEAQRRVDNWLDRLSGRRKRHRQWLLTAGAVGFALGLLVATAVVVAFWRGCGMGDA